MRIFICSSLTGLITVRLGLTLSRRMTPRLFCLANKEFERAYLIGLPLFGWHLILIVFRCFGCWRSLFMPWVSTLYAAKTRETDQLGTLLLVTGLICQLLSIVSSKWISHFLTVDANVIYYEGLWHRCTQQAATPIPQGSLCKISLPLTKCFQFD